MLGQVRLKVARDQTDRGVHMFELVRDGEDEVSFWLYGVDGEMWVVNHVTKGFIMKKTSRIDQQISFQSTATGDMSYRFPFLGAKCLGVALPQGPFGVSGPCDCWPDPGGGRAIEGLLFLMTLGASGLTSRDLSMVKSVRGSGVAAPLAKLPATDTPKPYRIYRRSRDDSSVCGDTPWWSRDVPVCVRFKPKGDPADLVAALERRWEKPVVHEGIVYLQSTGENLRKNLRISIEGRPNPSYGCAVRSCSAHLVKTRLRKKIRKHVSSVKVSGPSSKCPIPDK